MSAFGWFWGAHLLATIVAGVIATVALQYRETPGSVTLATMCAAGATWGSAVVVMLAVDSSTLLWALQTVRYLAAAVLVAAFLAFTLVYAGYVSEVSPGLVGLLALHPVAILVMVAAEPVAGWSVLTFVPDGTGALTGTGPGFVAHVTYAYVLLVVGTALLARAALRSGELYRRQYGLVLLGTGIPWLANVLYLVGPLRADLTPVAFTVTGACFLVAIRRYRMMDISPIARDTLVDLIGQAMVVVDDDGYVLDTNAAFAELFNIEEGAVGRELSAVLAEYPALASSLTDERVPDEIQGEDRWFEVTASELGVDTGRFSGRLLLLHEITERKERQQQVEASERRYRTLAENFPRGVVALFDESLTYVLVAGGLFEDIQLSPADFEGKHIGGVHTPGYVERFGDMFEAVFDGESATFEFSHGDRHYRTRLVPVRDAAGAVTQGLSMTTDITELRDRERDLRRQNEQLEMVAGVISHDLRNPLNVAIGRTELARETGDDSHLEAVDRAQKRMQDIIEDVLTLAREGSNIAETESLSLETLARGAWSHVDTDSASLRIEADMSFKADASRLSQVFENLFRNAVQHGPDGVTVTVGTLADGQGFYVADDGPGIPEDKHETVLEPGHTDHTEGTGLGLAIVANIVEAHGWSLSITTGESGGARFEVDLGDDTEWEPRAPVSE